MSPDSVVAAARFVQGVSVANAPFWFWWLLPVVTTVVVVAAVWLSRRDRRPTDSARSVEEYARFRAALGSQSEGHTTARGRTR